MSKIHQQKATLRRRACLSLTRQHIKSRKLSRSRLPDYIRSLERKVKAEKARLAELEAHRVIDEHYLRLMDEERYAAARTKHDI